MAPKIHPVVDGAIAWLGCLKRGGHSYDSQTQVCVMCGAHAQGPTIVDIIRFKAREQLGKSKKKAGEK